MDHDTIRTLAVLSIFNKAIKLTSVVFVNKFHGTRAVVKPKNDCISARQMQAARNKLCCSKNCACQTINSITACFSNGENYQAGFFENLDTGICQMNFASGDPRN